MPPMKKRNSSLTVHWRETRPFRASLGRTVGFATTVLFSLYHGVLGILHTSLWHGSICVYYLLLSLLRGCLLAAGRGAGIPSRHKKPAFYTTSVIMLAMNLTLVIPLSLMALDQRPVETGLIPAIASAAYTTYKVSAASVHLTLEKGALFSRELRLIRFFDALVSVLVLQNTLLNAVDGGVSQRMLPLVAISSGGIFLLILVMSLVWLVKGHAELAE